jgi:hypothetical protein
MSNIAAATKAALATFLTIEITVSSDVLGARVSKCRLPTSRGGGE